MKIAKESLDVHKKFAVSISEALSVCGCLLATRAHRVYTGTGYSDGSHKSLNFKESDERRHTPQLTQIVINYAQTFFIFQLLGNHPKQNLVKI